MPFNAWRSDQLSQATSSVVNKTGDGRIEVRRMIKRERRMERRVEEKWVHVILTDSLPKGEVDHGQQSVTMLAGVLF